MMCEIGQVHSAVVSTAGSSTIPMREPATGREMSPEPAGEAACATSTTLVYGHEWRDADGLPAMVALPAGEFIMGENADDKFANDTERPAHRVKLPAVFALGKYPVTTGEFRKFRRDYSPPTADDLPAIGVNWQGAAVFCQWLTELTGRHYRLPTEAEWEYACRAGTRTPFVTGHEITPAEANYLYDENGARIGVGRRSPVGLYPPNPFGLHDLHGNVGEWVEDTWHPTYHGAPIDGSAWVEAGGSQRVVRGGAWDYLPRLLRSSWRDWRLAEQCMDNIGFRVATSDLKRKA